MEAKLRLAAVGDSSALAPVARVARVLEPRTHPPVVVVTIEPYCPAGPPLATIRRKLVQGEIDAALCPASRLPLDVPQEIEVGAVIRCRDPRYQFLSFQHADLSLVPAGACVVVCDAIARAQILHRHPSLRVEIAPPTEAIVAGLRHGVWAAACVPAEVVESDPSLGSHVTAVPSDEVIPAIGQGLVVVLLRASGSHLRESVRLLNEPVEHCLHAQRTFLSRLGELRGTVASARAVCSAGTIELTGMLADEEGRWLVVDHARGPARFGEIIALEIAEACRKLAGGRAADPSQFRPSQSVSGTVPGPAAGRRQRE